MASHEKEFYKSVKIVPATQEALEVQARHTVGIQLSAFWGRWGEVEKGGLGNPYVCRWGWAQHLSEHKAGCPTIVGSSTHYTVPALHSSAAGGTGWRGLA